MLSPINLITSDYGIFISRTQFISDESMAEILSNTALTEQKHIYNIFTLTSIIVLRRQNLDINCSVHKYSIFGF